MVRFEHYRIRDRAAERLSAGHLNRTAEPDAPAGVAGEPERADDLDFLRQSLAGYEVLARVRQGGQGVVYKARQHGTGRIVALKLLLDGPLASEKQRARFAREIELVSRLRHPNIVAAYESGCVRGRHFYAMEFVEGLLITNHAVLHDLPPREIVRLVIKVCAAVHHAHQNGVIHRDLNPANILVDEAGEPRVYDFGLAKDLWTGSDALATLQTAPGCGTLPYLSPEQAGGLDGRADVRTDVYALGLVLYELLTDMLPYPIRGDNPHVRAAILDAEPLALRRAAALGGPNRAPGLSTINSDLEAIVAKALAKVKDDRYQTAAELAADLERWLSGDAVRARAASRWYVVRKTLRRHRVAVGVAAMLVAAALVTSTAIVLSWARVRVERDSARAAARTAYDLFDLALTEMEESVRPLAGGVAVRDRLIEKLADRLPELERHARSAAELDPVRTRLLEKQGDIALQQGQRAQAERFYRTFLEEALRYAAQHPADDAANAAVISGYRRLAQTVDDKQPWYEQGERFGLAVAESFGPTGATRFELCRLLLARANDLRLAGATVAALYEAERALALCPTDQPGGTPRDLHWLRLEAQAYAGRGEGLHVLGEAGASEEMFRRALELREEIVAARPADTEDRLALLYLYLEVGGWSQDAGRRAKAAEMLKKAAAQSDLLGLMDPSSGAWDRHRYAAHHRLAAHLLDLRRVSEARPEIAKAVEIATRWAARDPGPEAQESRFFALTLQGRLQRDELAFRLAYDSYQQAAVVAEGLLKEDTRRPTPIAQLIMALDGMAASATGLGDVHAVFRHRLRQYELQGQLVVLEPESVDVRLKSVAVHVRLAEALVNLRTPGDLAEAEELLDGAETALAQLEAAGKLSDWASQKNFVVQLMRATRAVLADCAADDTANRDGPEVHARVR